MQKKCLFYFVMLLRSQMCFNFSPEYIPETVGPPLDLDTSEVMARSFRVSWSHAPGNVETYRVVYSAQEGEPQEVQ